MDARALAKELLSTMAEVKVSDFQNPTNELLGTDYFAVQYLEEHQDVTPSELSQALNVTNARITIIIKRLEKKGLAVRSAHPTDQRKYVVNLSEEGKTYLDQAQEDRLKFVSDMLEYLGEDDAKAYVRIITKLAQRGSEK